MANQWQVGTHKTTVKTKDGVTKVTYHWTDVVKFANKRIVLNSGGWHTVTTKTRMNQASNQFELGYQVFQKDWTWYVDYKGQTLDFQDGMLLVR